jgi:signal transduction histidine kinase
LAWVLVGAGLLAVTVAFAAAPKEPLADPWCWLLVVITTIATVAPTKLSSSLEFDVSNVPMALAALLLGPATVVVATVVGEASSWRRQRYRLIAACGNVPATALPSMGLSWLLYQANPEPSAVYYAGVAGGCLAAFVLNLVLLLPVIAIHDGVPVREHFHQVRRVWPVIAFQTLCVISCLAVYFQVGASAAAFAIISIGASAYVSHLVLGARARAERAQVSAAAHRVLAQDLQAAERLVRARVAGELHDHAIQTLLVARQDLRDVELGRDDRLSPAIAAVEQAISQIRRTAVELHPVALQESGLRVAVEQMAEDQGRRAGFVVCVDVQTSPDKSTDDVLYGLSRELVTNTARHAAASKLDLKISQASDAISLAVTDDGTGFAPGRRRQALREGHLGLASWTERIRALGGDLSVHSAPGRGTRIEARIPVSN